MSTFLIGYDLNKKGQDYESLFEGIKELSNNTWWHHLDSTWLIKSDLTAVQVRDHLKQFIDGNDELLVINVTGRESAWRGFNDKGSQWLTNNL
ncbi:hypothetical protein [Chitinophaga sp.]|uniref:hypothetical protein n=1 Tax=Chitinophaga sp. TaxID=1869181 RepID=UPI0031E29507